jgi:hypothetical protein
VALAFFSAPYRTVPSRLVLPYRTVHVQFIFFSPAHRLVWSGLGRSGALPRFGEPHGCARVLVVESDGSSNGTARTRATNTTARWWRRVLKVLQRHRDGGMAELNALFVYSAQDCPRARARARARSVRSPAAQPRNNSPQPLRRPATGSGQSRDIAQVNQSSMGKQSSTRAPATLMTPAQWNAAVAANTSVLIATSLQ